MVSIGRNDPCCCGRGKKYKKCCLNKSEEEKGSSMRIILDDGDTITGYSAGSENSINSELFGETEFYRPHPSSILKIREEAEDHLRKKYKVGLYKDVNVINEIIQYQFSFFEAKLERHISEIGSIHFLEFLLYQYDQSSKIRTNEHKLGKEEQDRWHEIGPIARRAIKYLAERVVMLYPNAKPSASSDKLIGYLDDVWICSEEMTHLYMLSNQTIMIFPNDTELEILPENNQYYYDLKSPANTNFHKIADLDSQNKEKYIGKLSTHYPFDVVAHEEILNDVILSEFGCTYRDLYGVLSSVINAEDKAKVGFGIPLFNKDKIVAELKRIHSSLSEESILKILSGFTLTKENMESEDRQIWKPRQKYRAFRRGFFELNFTNESHIIFSKEMALEAWRDLMSSIVFKRVPEEWTSKELLRGIETVSNDAGKWFENIVNKKLEERNIIGKSFKGCVGIGKDKIQIPSDVGEIDFIGYSSTENTLFVLEYKMIQSGAESAYFRHDLDKLIGKDESSKEKSYNVKYLKKINWVKDNLKEVVEKYNLIYQDEEVKPNKVATAIITYTPSIVMDFLNDYPCVSLTNLLIEFDKANKWPFLENGIFEV